MKSRIYVCIHFSESKAHGNLPIWILSQFYPCHKTPSAWPRPMLGPYQAYHQLRVFAAQARRSLTLTDNDMVRVWPHLKVFLLFHDSIVRSRYEALLPFYIIVQNSSTLPKCSMQHVSLNTLIALATEPWCRTRQ
ncbi:hypothetical protein BKA82DRAFT_1001858 [Pisolithus tinctorius]|uniref:Uncharacterized protein n=1 Tax=Pisolithus tinctorius Marx 270 TaxID=870435 RepID=A0A0C3P614_PISTI|nr:hypothetical protein BKA82DRAFT_1001858 [Pisolithus tinctorius]KIO02961.1 hypothetical protein M404DRAFT_1001858 [Pisolithus tinctorius Marx 270]